MSSEEPEAESLLHKCEGYTCEHWSCAAKRQARVENLTRRPKRAWQPWDVHRKSTADHDEEE